MYFANDFHQGKVYIREDLQPGDRIQGPAIVIESTGTTVVEQDWELETNKLQPSDSNSNGTSPDSTSRSHGCRPCHARSFQ